MRHGKALLGLLMVGILLQTVAPQESIHKARPALFDPNRKTKPVSAISIGPTPAMIAALGGFRTVAADLLWLQAERVWDGGSWWALLPLLDAVTQLDPHFILAWQVYGWHAAYNMHAESETVIDRRYWLARGANILEQAVEANPDNWEIRFELGWTLYDRAHEKKRAAEYFYQADQMPGAKSYVTRLYYRCYEGILDIKDLMPALEYAKKRHTDLAKSDDVQHQVIVNRDYEWWMKHKDDPLEHRRQIVIENTARAQRSVPFYLYPDDPYWDVCPICGLPSKKGSEVCEVCGAPLKAPSQRGPATRGEKKT
jgi:tetratricopeptide (TPR) repeat protein